MAAYTALTTPSDTLVKAGDIISIPITDGETIYKGDIVRIVAAGTATSQAAPAQYDMFAGVAIETIVCTAGSGKSIRVQTNGVHSFLKSTPAQADVGCLAYVAVVGNEKTILLAEAGAAGGSVSIGAVVGIDPESPTTKVRVLLRPFITVGDAS